MSTLSSPSHGGILFPLEAFRPKILAAALAEGLVAKARNINDAVLRLTRHPDAGLVLGRIVGSVVDDEGKFWRENADLAMYASQALPRQCFLYFVTPAPDQRQGFMVAQRGQVIAADEGTPDNMPADAKPSEWPVAKLAEQIRVSLDDLESGFVGGPGVEISLLDPSGDDQTLLLQLAGQPPEDSDAAHAAPDTGSAAADPEGPATPGKPTAEQDQKRREAEQRAEREQREALAEKVRDALEYEIDDLGIVVAPAAELADADILAPFLVRTLRGDPPGGLPSALGEQLQGKRVDFAVKVEFLSEVFTDDGPLTKAGFEAAAEDRVVGGQSVRVMEVLAPRLSPGLLLRRGRSGVFVSRRANEPLPEALLVQVLDAQ